MPVIVNATETTVTVAQTNPNVTVTPTNVTVNTSAPGPQGPPGSGGTGGTASQTPWTSDIDGGGFSLSNVANITVSGTLSVCGASNLHDTNVSGALSVVGSLSVCGATNLGALNVSGALGVCGAATFNGGATVNGTLSVCGATNLGALNVSGNAAIVGTLTVSGAATFNGGATVNGTLSVSGTTNLGALNVSGALSVCGAAVFGGTVVLGVTAALDQVLFYDTSAGTLALGTTGNLAEELAPAAGDYFLVHRAEGDLVRVNWSTLPAGTGGGGGITAVVQDPSPALGGDLNTNTHNITTTGLLVIGGTTATAGSAAITISPSGNSITLSGNTNIIGTLTASGLVTANAGLNVVGTLGVCGTTNLGALNVSGNTAMIGTLTVSGLVTANAGVNVVGTLGVCGATNLGALNVSGNTVMIGTLTVSGLVTANNGITTTSGVFTGSLTVSGLATLNGGLTVNGTLNVSGATNLGALTVSGVSTFIGKATFSGGLQVGVTASLDQVVFYDTSAGTVALGTTGNIQEELAPATGDFILIHRAEGDLARANWSTLPAGGTGGVHSYVQSGAPVSPNSGDIWYDLDSGGVFEYVNDGNSSQWVGIAGSALANYRVPMTVGGRLTLVTATPVMTSTQSAKTTVYFTPYVGNTVPIYDGTSWVATHFTELSLALDSNSGHTGYHQSGKNFDLFIINDNGTVRLASGPAWTNDTTRAENISYLDGFLCSDASIVLRYGSLVGDTVTYTGRALYVGTMRASADGQTQFVFGTVAAPPVAAAFFLWNMYNRVQVTSSLGEATATWTYNSTTPREIRGDTTAIFSFVVGVAEDAVDATYTAASSNAGTGDYLIVGFGYDVTNAFSGVVGSHINTANAYGPNGLGIYNGIPAAGYHFLALLEAVTAAQTATHFAVSAGFQVDGARFLFRM